MRDVTCELCPRYCTIPEGGAGDCRVRVNIDGKLVATTYGRPSSAHIDPVEKKPLYHFHPGSAVFSIATAGCNLHCRNCQNWQLSQRGGEEMERIYRAEPKDVVDAALAENCHSIAYTYSDPIIFYEYVYDTSELAHDHGLKNIFVTAGYINDKPMRRLCRVIDAANIDLKAFDDGFYRRNCSGTLKPVLDAMVIAREEGVWLEVTNLVIPTLNESESLIRCLESLKNRTALNEIIVADGGSIDGTPEIAAKLGARVVESPKGIIQAMIDEHLRQIGDALKGAV